MTRVLFVASEAYPLVKTGGLQTNPLGASQQDPVAEIRLVGLHLKTGLKLIPTHTVLRAAVCRPARAMIRPGHNRLH